MCRLDKGPPPVPILAQLTGSGRIFVCQFDRPLKDHPVTTDNWTLIAFHMDMQLSNPIIDDDKFIAAARVGSPVGGPPRCSYDATPPDIQNLHGVPAAPFVDFPVEVFG